MTQVIDMIIQDEHVVDSFLGYLSGQVSGGTDSVLLDAFKRVSAQQPMAKQFAYTPGEYTFSPLPMDHTMMPAVGIEVTGYEETEEKLYGSGGVGLNSQTLWDFDVRIILADDTQVVEGVDNEAEQNLSRIVGRHVAALRQSFKDDPTIGGVFKYPPRNLRVTPSSVESEDKKIIRMAAVELLVTTYGG